MKRSFMLALTVALATAVPGSAAEVYLFVDAAPNVYGSPDYPAWQEAAFAAAAEGSFINMAGSVNACNMGTTKYEIEDEVVYSFGSLGRRLTWVYWIPGESIASLAGNFEVSLYHTWNGYFTDFYWENYGNTWLEPTRWEDYDADGDTVPDGVIGTAGVAWWGAYNVNTEEALEADLAAWGAVRETWQFRVKLFGEVSSVTSERRPVRITSLLSGCAESARNHGAFMRCLSETLNDLKQEGLLTGKEKGEIQSCAGQAVLP